MYLYLGKDTVLQAKDIIGIFDLEKSTVSNHTKSFLSKATKADIVENVSYDMPKSFIVFDTDNKRKIRHKNHRVYISPISTQTLLKRLKNEVNI